MGTDKVRFKKPDRGRDFYAEVKRRVAEDFKKRKASPHANWWMHAKVALHIFFWTLLYGLILSDHFGIFGVVILYSLLGITISLMGFNLTHDSLHDSYLPNSKWNRILGYSFDINGTSSMIWMITHNLYHHTFTNIHGHDQDIGKSPVLCLNPYEERKWFHRYQHLYAPFLYAIISLNWYFISDYTTFYKEAKSRSFSKKEVFLFFFFKIVNYIVLLIAPLLVLSLPVWQVLIAYLSMHLMGGLIISLTFQMAHIIEKVDFMKPNSEGQMEDHWATHELRTTANFATKSRIATEILGGLNHQVEHHLFPRMCHVHYPRISDIVRLTAEEYGLPYNEEPTLWGALCSHFRTLKKFGSESPLELQNDLGLPKSIP